MRLLAAFVLLCAVVQVSADAPQIHPEPEQWCRVTVKSIIDADTVNGDIHLPFGNLVMVDRSIRAHGYDAWETSRRRRVLNLTPEQWDVELQRGEKAKREFVELLDGGTLWISPIPQHEDIDPYDRIDARWKVYKGGIGYDVADYARQKGWVRK